MNNAEDLIKLVKQDKKIIVHDINEYIYRGINLKSHIKQDNDKILLEEFKLIDLYDKSKEICKNLDVELMIDNKEFEVIKSIIHETSSSTKGMM